MFGPSTIRTFDGRINVTYINITSYNISQQQRPVPNPRHTIFAFLISSLFNFLDLQYQVNGIVNPFQTHPKTMYVAFVSVVLYCFAYAAENESRFTKLGRGGMGLFGSILSVALASVLFNNSVSLIVYSLYILFSNGEMLCSVIEVFWSWIHRNMVVELVRVIRSINWRWFAKPVAENRGGIQRENLDVFVDIV